MTALLLLAALALPLALRGKRSLERLFPLVLFLLALLPLLATFVGGDHAEQLICWMLIAAGLPLALLMRSVRSLSLKSVVLAALLVLVAFNLKTEWSQSKRSRSFARIVSVGLSAAENPRNVHCAKGRCRSFFGVVGRVIDDLVREPVRNGRLWSEGGLCVLGVPLEFPFAFLRNGRRCGGKERSNSLWRAMVARRLLRPSKGRRPYQRVYGARKLTVLRWCGLKRRLARWPGKPCRWLVALTTDRRGAIQDGGPPATNELGTALDRWRAGVPGHRPKLLLRTPLPSGRVLSAYRLVRTGRPAIRR